MSLPAPITQGATTSTSSTQGAMPLPAFSTQGAVPHSASSTQGAMTPSASSTQGAMPPSASSTQGDVLPSTSSTQGAMPRSASSTQGAMLPSSFSTQALLFPRTTRHLNTISSYITNISPMATKGTEAPGGEPTDSASLTNPNTKSVVHHLYLYPATTKFRPNKTPKASQTILSEGQSLSLLCWCELLIICTSADDESDIIKVLTVPGLVAAVAIAIGSLLIIPITVTIVYMCR